MKITSIERSNGRPGTTLYPWTDMQVGDSFTVIQPATYHRQSMRTNATQAGYSYRMGFSVSLLRDGKTSRTWKVWRVR